MGNVISLQYTQEHIDLLKRIGVEITKIMHKYNKIRIAKVTNKYYNIFNRNLHHKLMQDLVKCFKELGKPKFEQIYPLEYMTGKGKSQLNQ